MGKTYRNKFDSQNHVLLTNVRDKKMITEGTISKRMKPYGRRGKFGVELSSGKTGVSRTGKLITANANRSLKKNERRNNKIDLVGIENSLIFEF